MPARRHAHDDGGAQAVEFALVSIPLLLLVGAIIQFSVLFWHQITLTQAAREGARLAAICNQDATCLSNVVSRTQGAAPGMSLSAGQVSVTPCPSTATNPPGNAIVVVTYTENIGGPIASIRMQLKGRVYTPCGG
jgi:Flp pilus assembly protein TadG